MRRSIQWNCIPATVTQTMLFEELLYQLEIR